MTRLFWGSPTTIAPPESRGAVAPSNVSRRSPLPVFSHRIHGMRNIDRKGLGECPVERDRFACFARLQMNERSGNQQRRQQQEEHPTQKPHTRSRLDIEFVPYVLLYSSEARLPIRRRESRERSCDRFDSFAYRRTASSRFTSVATDGTEEEETEGRSVTVAGRGLSTSAVFGFSSFFSSFFSSLFFCDISRTNLPRPTYSLGSFSFRFSS